MDTWYKEKYMYYHAGCYSEKLKLQENTWDGHDFVSIDSKGNVLGYIGYNIDRTIDGVTCLKVINFSEDTVTFGKDVKQAMEDIFEKYRFSKINFSVIIGNPIEKQYDRLVQLFGGRILGTYKDDTKLIDGTLHDRKVYEILRTEFMRYKER